MKHRFQGGVADRKVSGLMLSNNHNIASVQKIKKYPRTPVVTRSIDMDSYTVMVFDGDNVFLMHYKNI